MTIDIKGYSIQVDKEDLPLVMMGGTQEAIHVREGA
jgi:hypothetical protein